MIYSLNEIDAQCKKAARGVGFDWGYAEEIGKAVRWLAAYRLPCTGVFAAYLSAISTFPDRYQGPGTETGKILEAKNRVLLCPTLTGAFLCDRPDEMFTGVLQVKSIGFPLLLLPYMAWIIGDSEQGFDFRFGVATLRYADGKLQHNGKLDPVCHQSDAEIIPMNSKSAQGYSRAVTGINADDADWQILGRFAKRTYVPASEESRLGAGPSE